MRKNLGSMASIFPMPVLMIATYDNEGTIDVMNAAWGTMVDNKHVALNLTESHKTVKNIKETGCFTIGIADSKHVVEADYVGIVSGNNTKDKFIKSGLTATKAEFVNAPIINEFPIAIECKFIEYQSGKTGLGVIGEIVNVSVNENVLDEQGKIDINKVDAILYDTFNHGYYKVGEKVGQAFSDGNKLK